MIGSHIIPKLYLEQFSIPWPGGKSKSGRIWVYLKRSALQGFSW
jgi:hypothetical protein